MCNLRHRVTAASNLIDCVLLLGVNSAKLRQENIYLYIPVIFLNPFPNKPWFLLVCSTSLLKTLWEKEKLLVLSNFSFSTVFSTRLENFLQFSSNFSLTCGFAQHSFLITCCFHLKIQRSQKKKKKAF